MEAEDALAELLTTCQEAVALPPSLALALRPGIGMWVYISISSTTLGVDRLSVSEYLGFKEKVAGKAGWDVVKGHGV